MLTCDLTTFWLCYSFDVHYYKIPVVHNLLAFSNQHKGIMKFYHVKINFRPANSIPNYNKSVSDIIGTCGLHILYLTNSIIDSPQCSRHGSQRKLAYCSAIPSLTVIAITVPFYLEAL